MVRILRSSGVRAPKLLIVMIAVYVVIMTALFFYNLPKWCANPEARQQVVYLCK